MITILAGAHIRYGVGETLFKYNDNMEVEPWLATDYEFVDDLTVKITLRDGVKFSSGRCHGCPGSKGVSGRSDQQFTTVHHMT